MKFLKDYLLKSVKILLKIPFFVLSRLPFRVVHKKMPRDIAYIFMNKLLKAFSPGSVVRIKTGANRGLLWKIPSDLNSKNSATDRDIWDLNQMHLGTYERDVQRLLKSIIRPGHLCYDIGANVGFFTLLMARYAGINGGVEAFEPVAENVEAIKEEVQINRFTNVSVHQKVVSSDSGMVNFVMHDNDRPISQILESGPIYKELQRSISVMAQLLHSADDKRDIYLKEQLALASEGRIAEVVENTEKIRFKNPLYLKHKKKVDDIIDFFRRNHIRYSFHTVRMESVSLDDLVGNALKPPDFVKLDVEGAEGDVIKGMRGTLKKYHPILYVELHTEKAAAEVKNTLCEVGGYRICNTDFVNIDQIERSPGVVCIPEGK
ncbi:MAG: FkbM family methyltransferase [Candidatus Omnitrophica bacterium]|nr:FkbM family methyltransferase [Candidatus Omnitrophota bacterium]